MALVAHGWAAPAAVEPERESVPEPITRFLEGLAALPGAEYVLAVDAGGERVRGEWGGPPGPAMAVIDWARRVAEVSHGRRHELEDLVLTTDTAFHLVRLVAPPAADDQRDPAPLWVSVRVDRSRGNLAWSRRALAGLGAPGTVPGPRAITAGPQLSTPSRPSTPSSPSTPAEPFAPIGTPGSRPSTPPEPFAPIRTPAGTVPAPSSGPARSVPPTASRPGASLPTSGASAAMPTGPSRPSPAASSPAGPEPLEPEPMEPVEPSSGRAWFTPFSSATGSSSPAPERPARRPSAPSSWFSPTSGSGASSDSSSRGPARPDSPAAGPATGGFPAAMPAPAGSVDARPADVPAPRRDDRDAAADPGRGSGPSERPQRERGGVGPEARRSDPVDADPDRGTADSPSSRRLPLTVRQATWWSGRGERADMAELGPPTGPNLVVPAPDLPAARTSTEDRPAPAVPAPRLPGSLFASVVVVPPPPSPVPEDDGGQDRRRSPSISRLSTEGSAVNAAVPATAAAGRTVGAFRGV
ncbi:MAG TPA: hypothetical protein VGH76_13180, partial [Actinomycetospora sp.]